MATTTLPTPTRKNGPPTTAELRERGIAAPARPSTQDAKPDRQKAPEPAASIPAQASVVTTAQGPDDPREEPMAGHDEEDSRAEAISGEDMEKAASVEEMHLVIAPSMFTTLMQVPLGTIAGDLNGRDYAVPRLRLLQGLSRLIETDDKFRAGQWVAGDEVIVWAKKWNPCRVTFLRSCKVVTEVLSAEEKKLRYPRLFPNDAEAEAAGLRVLWGEEGTPEHKPQVAPQFRAVVLLRLEEGMTDESGLFNVDTPDGKQAMLEWIASDLSYGQIVPRLTRAQAGWLKSGSFHGYFHLSARQEKNDKGEFWLPMLTNGGLHSEAMVHYLAANF